MPSKSEIIFPGAKYDALTILHRIPRQGRESNVCRCRCDCGKIVTVQEQKIGRCLRGETYKRLDCGCGIANLQQPKLERKPASKLSKTEKTPEKKHCKRYDCLYHPSKNAANNCDYFWINGKYRKKGENGECLSYTKSTPEEKQRMKIDIAEKQIYFGGGYVDR